MLIKQKNGVTANPAGQSMIVAEYFKKNFYKNKLPIRAIPLTQMAIPFTADEILKFLDVSLKLWMWWDPGWTYKIRSRNYTRTNQRNIQHYGRNRWYTNRNNIWSSEIPSKAKYRYLIPMIIFSSLRKILAACIINRIKDTLGPGIPPSQAARRPNRSRTEHIFTYLNWFLKDLSQQETN